MKLDIGTAVRPYPGQMVSGDVVRTVTDGARTLVVVADGLGHGPEAADAALRFAELVESSVDRSLRMLFDRGNDVLRGTRGAAACAISCDLSRGRMEIAAIGNVVARRLRGRVVCPPPLPGILGRGARARVAEIAFEPGDAVLVASDGLRSTVDLGLIDSLPAQAAADEALRLWARTNDDASCAVVACNR
jgi:serine/threonine protein phosphatase PrpC